MNKPIKPNIIIPESFAKNGVKTDFDSDLIASGFDDLKPDVLAGDNLNKFIDDTYQGLNYGMAAADAINLINEGETLTVKEGQLVSDKISGGTGLQMFDTILKDHVLTYEETKGLALQGTYVYKEALAGSRYGYPDFYNRVVEEFNEATSTEEVNGITIKVHSNGHKFYDIDDKTAIDSFYNSTGLAWFYGVDIENERVFLPRNSYLTSYVQDGKLPIVDNGMTLGLTNGNENCGLFDLNANSLGLTTYTTKYGVPVDSSPSLSGGAYVQRAIGVTTDPTKSGIETKILNSQNGMYLYICVGNTTNYEGVTDVVNQGMEILEQVSDKVNTDGTNLNAEGRSLFASYAMPSSRYIDLTLGASGTIYTAPANGYFFIDKLMSGAENVLGFAYNEIANGVYTFTSMVRGVGTNYAQTVWIPVLKGQEVVCNYDGNGTCRLFRFYYAEGSESEAN